MSGARHREIADDLAEGIASGRFPVGSILPTELELCARYGTSRHTIRAALDALQGLGLVSRRKKMGTRVEAAQPRRSFRQSLASVEDLVQFGEAHRREVREVREVTTDHDLAEALGCEPGRRWLRISSLRRGGQADAPPLGWTDVYVDEAYAGLHEVVQASPATLISHLIEQQHGRRVSEISQDVQAVLLSGRAAALEAEPGTPALRIVRRYADEAGDVFLISATLHPADRFTLSSQLRRERGR